MVSNIRIVRDLVVRSGMEAPEGAGNTLRCHNRTAAGRTDPSLAQANPRPGLWRRLRRLNDRLEDSWLGDLIGGLSLFGACYLMIILGALLQ